MTKPMMYVRDFVEKSADADLLRAMIGFKAFHSAGATIAGIETAHMIRKGQIPANGDSAFQTFAKLAG